MPYCRTPDIDIECLNA